MSHIERVTVIYFFKKQTRTISTPNVRKNQYPVHCLGPNIQVGKLVRFLTPVYHFRYTMPRMVLKQESRLNGVKTNITNLTEVANALRVPPAAVIKYFCAEVGANQELDSIVKGSHTYDALAKLLDK